MFEKSVGVLEIKIKDTNMHFGFISALDPLDPFEIISKLVKFKIALVIKSILLHLAIFNLFIKEVNNDYFKFSNITTDLVAKNLKLYLEEERFLF